MGTNNNMALWTLRIRGFIFIFTFSIIWVWAKIYVKEKTYCWLLSILFWGSVCPLQSNSRISNFFGNRGLTESTGGIRWFHIFKWFTPAWKDGFDDLYTSTGHGVSELLILLQLFICHIYPLYIYIYLLSYLCLGKKPSEANQLADHGANAT